MAPYFSEDSEIVGGFNNLLFPFPTSNAPVMWSGPLLSEDSEESGVGMLFGTGVDDLARDATDAVLRRVSLMIPYKYIIATDMKRRR